MKLLPKVLKIAAILIVTLFAVLFSVSLIMQNKVAGIILKSLNKNFSTKIETESYRLSLVKKFPKATVELKNVFVHSSPDFDRSFFAGINTDTLLAARSAFIYFKLIDLLKGDYTFTSITVKSGNLNLFTDTAGRDNYDVSPESSNKSVSRTSLNLNRINLSDIMVVYNDRNADLTIKSMFRNSRIKSRISGNNIDFESNSAIIFEYFQLGNFIIKQRIPADVEAGLSQNEKGIFFRKSTLSIDTWDFIFTGFIAADNFLDLAVSGQNIDIAGIANILPDKYKKAVSEYNPSGILKLESTIKGISSRALNPHYEITWSLKDANIDYRKSKLKVDNFSFDGFYSNGKKNTPETSTLTISNFTTRLGSADYKGSFKVSDFKKPKAELAFTGTLLPSELADFLNLQNVEDARGSVNFNIMLNGFLRKKENYTFSDILDLESHSDLVFKSFGIRLKNRKIDLKDVNGEVLLTGKNTSTSNLKLDLNDQKIILSSNVMNFPGWLSGSPVNLTGSASISASCIKPVSFLKSSSESEKVSVPTSETAPVTFPADVVMDMEFNIDTLIYKSFTARNVRGTLNYRPKLLNFRIANLNSQEGIISGNGLIVQNSNKSFIGKGNFTLSGIDVNETFTTFNNFGQDFLKAENIDGSLSGTLSLLIPVDSLLKPDIKSVTAEGKYLLIDGALINFDPVKELSSFIELSELHNIKFDQLENDFFIRSNALYMPQMDVRSSAVDLAVNGKHSFTNDYVYHVKLQLSEILSNKARKNKNLTSEFGEVEDDGLGRTSILLKVEGNGEDVKVSYDMEAAGKQVREDIRKERQTLKNILNEEYGWYKSDPEVEKKPPSKPRFRIKWEGSDTTVYETEASAVKKEGILKKILRKNR